MVDLALWEAAEVEQQFGACITAQMGSLHPKLRALTALVKLRGAEPKLIKKIEDFQRSLHELGETRARIVHDPRLTSSNGTVVRWQTTANPKEIVFGPQPETIDDLVKIRSRIARRIADFEKLRVEIRAAVLVPGSRPVITLQRIVENPGHPD
jgi:hypothetical protein